MGTPSVWCVMWLLVSCWQSGAKEALADAIETGTATDEMLAAAKRAALPALVLLKDIHNHHHSDGLKLIDVMVFTDGTKF